MHSVYRQINFSCQFFFAAKYPAVKGCDATMHHSSNTARYKKNSKFYAAANYIKCSFYAEQATDTI